MPAEWDTYRLVQVGLSVAEADEIPSGRADELLAIHEIVSAHAERARS